MITAASTTTSTSPAVSVADDPRWPRIVARDQTADGHIWYSVSTTRIYCRPSCPSRLAHPRHVRLHDSLESAKATGFRACRRCRPDSVAMLDTTQASLSTGMGSEEMRFAVGQTSLGTILVASSAKGIASILLGDDPEGLVRDLQDRFPRARLIGADRDYERLVARVIGFVEQPASGVDVPLDVRGTAFQRRVWQALQAIPVGKKVTYAEIARRIGSSNAVRAVAGACAANNLAVAIPCHRVVRSDGSLSGYAWGVERKRALLTTEAMAAHAPAIVSGARATSAAARVAAYDWQALAGELDDFGCVVLPKLLSSEECRTIANLYCDERHFRSHVQMARHGFGKGEYRYFKYPLPELLEDLRTALYPRLAVVANAWNERMGLDERHPADHASFLERCHAAGQTRPTPLLLQYVPGDFNCLHQDLYGDLAFPIQVATLLSEPGIDFTGGEFVLTEQRPRMQSRAEVVPLRQGDAVAFAVHHRPVRGSKGNYRVNLRHGVSRVRSGMRHTVGIIFHDAT